MWSIIILYKSVYYILSIQLQCLKTCQNILLAEQFEKISYQERILISGISARANDVATIIIYKLIENQTRNQNLYF